MEGKRTPSSELAPQKTHHHHRLLLLCRNHFLRVCQKRNDFLLRAISGSFILLAFCPGYYYGPFFVNCYSRGSFLKTFFFLEGGFHCFYDPPRKNILELSASFPSRWRGHGCRPPIKTVWLLENIFDVFQGMSHPGF